MSKLFETTSINNINLKNRFIRSATWEGMADKEGFCTPQLIKMMENLAKGDIGLIITGHSYVSKEGQATPWQLGAYSRELLHGLNQMTDAVHKADGKIILQLAHAGCYAAVNLTGEEAIGPSVISDKKGEICREMTKDDIQRLIDDFVKGAELAHKSGFDGIQIHAAHGYLLSQFLSPLYNKRKDQYGGNIESRSRIITEIIQAIRNSVGDKFPVLIKINSEDFIEGGFTQDDMLKLSESLEKAGIDAIELSGGMLNARKYNPVRAGANSEDKEVFYKDAAKKYKEKIHVPLILVGGIRSFHVAEKLVNNGITDYISMSRPFIREPHLIKRWKSGDISKASCISDNKCFKPAMEGKGICCVTAGA